LSRNDLLLQEIQPIVLLEQQLNEFSKSKYGLKNDQKYFFKNVITSIAT